MCVVSSLFKAERALRAQLRLATSGYFHMATRTHGLFWFWIEHEKVVMVISCFKL